MLRFAFLICLVLAAPLGLVAADPLDTNPDHANPDHANSDHAQEIRTDLFISGVYPHLTTYGVYSQNGAHHRSGHDECGIGAIVPWAGKLWMVNYAPHQPRGSEHKLFSIAPDLTQAMTIHPESVGGTPAGRMIHAESKQLLIAHYLIDAEGRVRTISPAEMPMRVTAIARHLSDPANLVYYIDMEGAIWEANVHTLAVKRLFVKPVPGWHSKGGYTSQGRLVISNNGELAAGNYNDLLVGGAAQDAEERGVLAEYDATQWKIVERRQYTEVTGPAGISGGSDGDDPIWAIGWDRRSLRLQVRDQGAWHTYLLPKAAYCNDASHGWYTEWPRIREITDGRWMMDMHGMFFDFPKTFSADNSKGIRPIASHLRYIPDFCEWNGQLVLATDETSIQGNPLAGQPQSNLWWGSYEDLKTWGPATAYGCPWIEDQVTAHTPSDPFLIAGFDRRVLHLVLGRKTPPPVTRWRATNQLPIQSLPDELAELTRVTVPRGDWHQPAAGFTFHADQPVSVYLAVDQRGNPRLPDEWELTDHTITWGEKYQDSVYKRNFDAGEIEIPANPVEHIPGSFGMPHMAMIQPTQADRVNIKPSGNASVTQVPTNQTSPDDSARPVTFTLEVDRNGNGEWEQLQTITVPANGYVPYYFPADSADDEPVWLRLTANRDCTATALLHQTAASFVDGDSAKNRDLFAGLAEVSGAHGDAQTASDRAVLGGRVYAAKRNRNLRMIAADDRFYEFTKAGFEFKPDAADAKLDELLQVEREFSVDDASVIIRSRGKTYRLPKGDSAYDRAFASGWPRAIREVQSERQLANIHGTFYELPLVTNGAPPAWNLVRPVSSHSKQITDFCSWNGLLVLAGVRRDANLDGHVFLAPDSETGLWLGAIDDVWKLGKPIGVGGPWNESQATAGEPSDPYLMAGYDRKSVWMSHDRDDTVTLTLQVDIDGNGLWVDYKSFSVAAGKTVAHDFPAAFSARWLRAVIDRDAAATVMLRYE